MNFDEIRDELNNPNFKIDMGTFFLSIHSTNLMNSYHLKSILKRQVEILEMQKGKSGQELVTSVEAEMESLNEMFSSWLAEDLINLMNDSSKE